jgi:hypothetical protein
MTGKRAVTGLLAAFVIAVSFVVVPAALAVEPPPNKQPGHDAWTFCHRVGSDKNQYVVITTDDAAWAEAHVHGSDPAHPMLDGRDDIFIGLNLTDKKAAEELCKGGDDGGGKG